MSLRVSGPAKYSALRLMSGATLALLLVVVSPVAGADASAESDVIALAHAWSGVFDVTEQMFFDTTPELTRPPGSQLRLQVQVAQVELPWLSPTVLYLEERPFDAAGVPQRQVLLGLTTGQQPGTVRVQQYTFAQPAQWVGLAQRPQTLARLTTADVVAHPGCDLQLLREAGQFRGGTLARACRNGATGQYVDYQLLLGDELYWYRQRMFTLRGDELRQEIAGFTLIDVENARLFTCLVSWRAAPDAVPQTLLTLDLHDQAGRGRFATPDGRRWRITLYGHGGSFANGVNALRLELQNEPLEHTLASSWTASAGRAIALDYEQLSVRCAPILPESDELPS